MVGTSSSSAGSQQAQLVSPKRKGLDWVAVEDDQPIPSKESAKASESDTLDQPLPYVPVQDRYVLMLMSRS